MSTITYPFPDVNVWVALISDRHPHYAIASAWAESVTASSEFYLSRFTQLGVLRLLTRRSAMGEDTLNMSEAWIAYDTLIRYWGGLILPEPPDMDETFRRLTNRDEVSPNYWADAYLSAFAKGHGLTLVTFDRALAGKVKESILLGPSSRV